MITIYRIQSEFALEWDRKTNTENTLRPVGSRQYSSNCVLFDFTLLALRRLATFEQYFQSKKKTFILRFLLRFPGECESDWEKHRHLQWPFDTNNIDYCLEEHRLHDLNYRRCTSLSPKKIFSLLVFTRSPLPYRRTVHNHSFTMRLQQQSPISSIKWTCDFMENFEQIRNTLSKFQTTKKLEINTWGGTVAQNVRSRNQQSGS